MKINIYYKIIMATKEIKKKIVLKKYPKIKYQIEYCI